MPANENKPERDEVLDRVKAGKEKPQRGKLKIFLRQIKRLIGI